MIRKFCASLLLMACAAALPASAIAAQTDGSPADTFQNLCVMQGARINAVVDAARAAGFAPAKNMPATPAGFTQMMALERGDGLSKQVLVVSSGKSAVSKALPIEVPSRACAVTDASGTWDARAFALQWTGISPQVDAEGAVLYSYLERSGHNIFLPGEDLSALVAGLNAGEVRTLAVFDEPGRMRTLFWLVFEAPPSPIVLPAAPSHDQDPFAPCRWEDIGKGQKAQRVFSCPDDDGKFRSTKIKDLTEETPRLAQGGDTAAMLRLAAFYADGPKVVRDPAAAFFWSKRGADAGSPGGAFNTGLAYDNGIGVSPDRQEALRWYRIAADLGSSPAMVNLAALLLANSNDSGALGPEAAVALLHKAADAGSNDGLFNMGYLAETGIGVEKDMVEAQRWYRLAADRKDARAMLRLGSIYADGIGGVPRDEAEAVRWLVAGVTPVLDAATAISGIQALIIGFNNPKRRAEAARAAASDPSVALCLGMYLVDRENPSRQPGDALVLLRRAADAGIPAAALRIGLMFAEGDGVSKDNAEAIRWLRADTRLATTGSFQKATKFADGSGQ